MTVRGGVFALIGVVVTVFCILYMVQYALNDLSTREAEHPGNLKGDLRLTPIVWKCGTYTVLAVLLASVLNYVVGLVVPGAWDPRSAYLAGAGCCTILVTSACFLIVPPWTAVGAFVVLNLPWVVDYLIEAVRVFRTVWRAFNARGVA